MSEIIMNSNSTIETRQPKALIWLFMTELWERFAYWSLYSLLVLYMVHRLHMGDATAYVVFGAFNALLYASPILGGWLADRYLTQKRAIIHGAIWMMLGYGLLAGSNNSMMIYLSLGLLIWGNGLFKPNISTQLGACYHDGDSNRQRGFTIYYMGINIGATIGVLGCGWLATNEGWGIAFSLVAISMGIGLLTYILKLPVIEKDIKRPSTLKPTIKNDLVVVGLGLLLIVPLSTLLSAVSYANIALMITVIGLGVYLGILIHKQTSRDRNRMILCLVLTISSIAFWALYMQMGSSLTLYADRCATLTIGHYVIGASMISSVNGIWLLLLSPVLVKVWQWLSLRNLEPRTDSKFLMGILLMMLGYVLLAVTAWCLAPGEKSNLSWIVSSYGLQTLGELCLSPIGLAMVTELAPSHCKSLMMGVWFLATAVASALSGQLAKISAVPVQTTHHLSDAKIYAHAFTIDALVALITAIVLLCLMPSLRKLI